MDLLYYQTTDCKVQHFRSEGLKEAVVSSVAMVQVYDIQHKMEGTEVGAHLSMSF